MNYANNARGARPQGAGQGRPTQQQPAAPNLPPAGMNALLGMAGKQLGKDPAQLKAQLQGGQLDQVLGGLPPQKAAQVTQLLSDPQQLEKLLNSPQVKSLLSGFMKQK